MPLLDQLHLHVFSVTDFVKLEGKRTKYDSDTNLGTIAEINTGSLLLMTIGSSATGAELDCQFDGEFRLRFTG